MKAQPSSPARVAAAHTIPREDRAFFATRFDPDQAAKVTVPTLPLIGSESPAWKPEAATMAGALPNARITGLEGQAHIADLLAPEVIAGTLLAFLAEGR